MIWGWNDALAPQGPLAGTIAWDFSIFLAVCTVVYGIVIALVVVATLRRRRAAMDHRRRAHLVTLGAAATAVILLGLLGVSMAAGRVLAHHGGKGSLTVRVIAHQWWWEFQYEGNPPSQMVTTANELHIPTGTSVQLILISRDVIHSFWVPSLHGKRDLIPGHESTTTIQANTAGTYRGQCAEFCGLQHAHMGMLVVAEAPEAFQRWLAAQRKPAAPPRTALAERGREVFMNGPCPLCHTVLGTMAFGAIGPDLTHLASRQSLAAGTLPNTRGHLAGWITNPQTLKPGNRMPPVVLPSQDLQALLAYLEDLP